MRALPSSGVAAPGGGALLARAEITMNDRTPASRTTRLKSRLLPVLAVLAVAAVSPVAAAETKSVTAEPTADELVRQGAASFDARDYEGARQAFSRAYELQPTPDALLNLALAEFNVKRTVEGIAHLRAYVRLPAVAPAQAASVRDALLRKAYAKVVRVSVSAPDGTAVQVDDRPEIVKAGEDESIIVLPGPHKLRAANGKTVEFTGEAGAVLSLALPAPTDTRPKSAPPPMAKPAAATPEPLQRPSAASSAADVGGNAWDTRAIVLTVGAGVTLAALGAGAYFAAKQAGQQGEIDTRLMQLEAKYGTPNSCREGRAGAADPWCAELKDMADTKVQAQNLATASFIAAGVAGAGTIAAFLLWPREQHFAENGIVFTPIADRGIVGVSVRGMY